MVSQAAYRNLGRFGDGWGFHGGTAYGAGDGSVPSVGAGVGEPGPVGFLAGGRGIGLWIVCVWICFGSWDVTPVWEFV